MRGSSNHAVTDAGRMKALKHKRRPLEPVPFKRLPYDRVAVALGREREKERRQLEGRGERVAWPVSNSRPRPAANSLPPPRDSTALLLLLHFPPDDLCPRACATQGHSNVKLT